PGGAGARDPRAPRGRQHPRGSRRYRHHRRCRRLDDRAPGALERVRGVRARDPAGGPRPPRHHRREQRRRATQSELQRAGRDAEAVRVWEERSRASLLTDPTRFGGFWWLLLGTEGLPEPPWLARGAPPPATPPRRRGCARGAPP